MALNDAVAVVLSEKAVGNLRLRLESGLQKCALHLRVEPGGCSGFRYVIAFADVPTPAERDGLIVIESECAVIFMDTETEKMLRGSVIDYDISGFSIHNPNARTACNCGGSFSLPASKRNRVDMAKSLPT